MIGDAPVASQVHICAERHQQVEQVGVRRRNVGRPLAEIEHRIVDACTDVLRSLDRLPCRGEVAFAHGGSEHVHLLLLQIQHDHSFSNRPGYTPELKVRKHIRRAAVRTALLVYLVKQDGPAAPTPGVVAAGEIAVGGLL